MKAGNFAVSIQCGSHYHYFTWTGDDYTKACEEKKKAIAKTVKRGAGSKMKRTAHLWKQVVTPE